MARKKKKKNNSNSNTAADSLAQRSPSSSSSSSLQKQKQQFDAHGNDEQHGDIAVNHHDENIKCKGMVLAVTAPPTMSKGKKSRNSRNVMDENKRIIYLSEVDANRLNICSGDRAIVVEMESGTSESSQKNENDCQRIKWDENMNIGEIVEPKFISLCEVNVIKSTKKGGGGGSNKSNNNNNNKRNGAFSPKSPNSTTNQIQLQVSRGEAKLNPAFLSQRLFIKNVTETIISSPIIDLNSAAVTTSTGITTTPSQSKQQQKATIIQTPTNNTTATTPKSNFSFESFVKSSPSTSGQSSFTSPGLKQGGSQRSKAKIAILPLKEHLSLSRQLLISCTTLHLRLYSNSTPSDLSTLTSTAISKILPSVEMLKRSTKLLERMVLAVCNGEYLRYKDVITISFQGKWIQFEVLKPVQDMQMDMGMDNKHPDNRLHNVNVEELDQSFATMKLDDSQQIIDAGGDCISQSVSSQFIEKNGRNILYYVSFSTQVIFDFDESRRPEESTIHTNLDSKEKKSTCRTGKVVAGVDFIIKQIHTFLTPTLIHPELFPTSGPIRAPKGILVHGSSGCGKSLLAKQVVIDIQSGIYYRSVESDDKTKIQVDTVHVNCSSIQATSSIVGEAERKLSKLFKKAEYRTTQGISTLLILDDVHLICPRRGATGGGGGGSDRVASTLLALMDGIGQNHNVDRNIEVDKVGNVAILAITTSPALLDPALRRAGRLDTEIEVPNPDDNTRAEIFKLIFSELIKENVKLPKIDSDLLKSYAKAAKGFTGADCALSVKEAVRQALSHLGENKTCDCITVSDADMRHAIKMTKPSAIKSITVEIPSVPWSSIGGMDEVKNLLREAIELPMTHSHLFEALQIPPPRGVLLYGPPGCSKTLMARALATEGNMNFLAVKGPELLSKWLGESERQLASLFRRARLASPCVIFFDEMDAIASKRGSNESSGGERMLSQLLTELDGINRTGSALIQDMKTRSQPRVVVVGATNRPDLLDSALTRPGRIDRMIYVGLPDQKSREGIYQIQFRGKACDPDLDITKLATASRGFSGAEIVSICREAALYAIEDIDKDKTKNEPMIQMKHVIRSINSTKRQITPEMLNFYDKFGRGK